VILVAILATLVALSEGIGIVLLVPLLGALDGGSAGALLDWLPAPRSLAWLLGLFVGLIAARAGLQLLREVETARLERTAVTGLRAAVFAALLGAEWRAQSRHGRAALLNSLVTDIDRVGFACHELVALAAALLAVGAAFLAALALSPGVAIAALFGGCGVIFAYGALRGRALARGETLRATYARLHALLGDTLSGLRLVKSFGAQQRSEASLHAIERGLTADRLAYQRASGLGQALLQLGGAALLALLVWLAVSRWQVAPLVILPLIALFARVLPLLGAIQLHWQNWLQARPALDSALAFMAALQAEAEPQTAGVEVPRPRRSIVLDRVSLRHPGREAAALDHVDIVLPADTTTALVGPSGAGKSTVADLLGGLLAPDDGAIVLDGHALSPAERIAWRAQVAYVQQEPVLFDASVRQNLAWAVPDASLERIEQALRDASAEFVFDLPQGLDTPVGDAGRQFSGGERQRIVLARALLRDPALLILDEATSALDPANEAAVAAAVARLKGKLTVLTVGHRGSLAENADQVVRLEGGRVVEHVTRAVAP
jgi:ATP-binding cassette subfamily C protein